MNCRKCDIKMIVMETRTTNNQTYRRYKCPACGSLIHTEEMESKTAKNEISKIHRKYFRKYIDIGLQDMVK